MSVDRMLRVNSLIKRELCVLIDNHRKETGSALITVTDVEVSRDLKYAKVFVSIMNEKQKKENIIAQLQALSPYFFREISRVITLKSIPKLQFVLDTTAERSSRVFSLLEQIKKEEPSAGEDA